jgi:hypothetical protein
MGLKIALIIIAVCNLTLISTMATADIEPARMKELGSERAFILSKIKELDATKGSIATLQAERSAAEVSALIA